MEFASLWMIIKVRLQESQLDQVLSLVLIPNTTCESGWDIHPHKSNCGSAGPVSSFANYILQFGLHRVEHPLSQLSSAALLKAPGSLLQYGC